MKTECLLPRRLCAMIALAIVGLRSAMAAAADAPAVGDEPVKLSPFEVSSTKDKGYLAANSISGTRISIPIGELPFTISAYTPQFIQDTRAEKMLDIVMYSPGVRS